MFLDLSNAYKFKKKISILIKSNTNTKMNLKKKHESIKKYLN
jgi:hypothetical protein